MTYNFGFDPSDLPDLSDLAIPEDAVPTTKSDTYFEIEVTPEQLKALWALAEGRRPVLTEYQRNDLRDACTLARLIRAPLHREHLPWGEIERDADRQGCSVADAIYDRAGKGREA